MSLLAKLKSKFVRREIVYLPAPTVQMVEPLLGAGPELPHAESRGQVKLGIIVGHESRAQGAQMASPFKIYEYSFNKDIANRAQAYARAKHPNVIVEVILRDGIGISGAYLKARKALCDAVVELHFNAANTRAHGSETLCTADTNDVDFAHVMHDMVCQVFERGNASRGVKCISRSDRGNINVHSFPGGANCLLEPFFGDNETEAKAAMEKKDHYAQGIIEGAVLWAKKVDLLR